MTTPRFVLPAVMLLGAAGLLAGFAPRAETATPTATTTTAADTYEADAVHSSILFQIRHAGVSNFYGRFNEFTGSFTFNPDSHEAGDFVFEVQTESVDTHNAKRDEHLRTADFFNARQFPTISFKGTSVEHIEGDRYTLAGDMTMQGETKPVTAALEWLGTGTGPSGKTIGGFEARFEIKRSDFGMTKYLAPDGSDSGGLGNTVKLIVSIEAIKQ